jgi:DNA-binding NtrC family response regulator
LLQAKILSVLEMKKFRPVGSYKDIAFTGRVIAATHENLLERVQERKFREDLYYRLTVFTIDVPPLNQRVDDIPHLVRAFQAQKSNCKSFDDRALKLLKNHDWKGNVRELKNLIDRVRVLCDDNVISASVLSEFINIEVKSTAYSASENISTIADSILKADVENKFIAIESALLHRALELSEGNKSAAARLLGVHRKVIERKCASTSLLDRPH